MSDHQYIGKNKRIKILKMTEMKSAEKKTPRKPRTNPEMERAALGCMILAPQENHADLLDKAFSLIPPDALGEPGHADAEPLMSVPANQTILRAIASLRLRGTALDLHLLGDNLLESGYLEAVGGAAYLAGLEDDVFAIEQLTEYIDKLLRHWQARSIVKIQNALARAVEASEPTQGLKARLASLEAVLGQGAGQESRPKRSLLTVRQLFALKLPDDDNLLGDRLLAEGQAMSLIGMGDLGKSRLSLQLAICSIIGWDWLGIPTTAKGRRWLFFQTENNARRLTMDLAGMLRGYSDEQIEYISNRLIIQANLTDLDSITTLTDDQVVLDLQAEVKALKPDIIVFDPLVDYYAGENQNDEQQMRLTVNIMKSIARAVGLKTALLIIHHARGGREATSGAIGWGKTEFGLGSKGLYRAVRAQINIANGDPEDENPPLIIACGKNNNGRKFDPFAVRLNRDRWWYEVEHGFDFENWKNEVSSTKKYAGVGRKQLLKSGDVLARVGTAERPQAEVVRELAGAHNVSEATAKRKILELVNDGVIGSREEQFRGNVKKHIIWATAWSAPPL